MRSRSLVSARLAVHRNQRPFEEVDVTSRDRFVWKAGDVEIVDSGSRPLHTLRTDGSGNGSFEDPAEGAIGAVLKDVDGNVVDELSEWIGPATNTIAEYWALVEGLRMARRYKVKHLEVRVDSQLLVDQLKGSSRVTKEYLMPLHRRAAALLKEFDGNVAVAWNGRKGNAEADRLAAKALTERPKPTT